MVYKRTMKRVWLVAMIFALGCGDEAEPSSSEATDGTESAQETESAEEAPAAEIPPPTPAQALMHGHYRRASEARDALIRADIEGARGHMAWLATHEEGDALAPNLRPMLTAMQTEAARFAEASTMTEAGDALARTLVQCGNCHQASGGGFVVALPPMPAGEGTAAHMQRHMWSAERMWEGLVTADDEQFRAGTDALREAPLHDEHVPAANTQPEGRVDAITELVHQLGVEAQDASTPEARASIYGRYLATCGTCHRLLGQGPQAPVQPTLEP